MPNILPVDVGFGYPAFHTAEIAKTANYTVLPSDSGRLLTTTGASGAVTFTLPARTAGLIFWFYNTVDQTMTVTSAAGSDIVFAGTVSKSSIAFSTGADKAGAYLMVYTNLDGSKWYVGKLCGNAATAT